MFKILPVVVLTLIFAQSAALGADSASTPFSKGTAYFSLEADYAHSCNLSWARIESGSIGIGYYFFDNFSLGVDAMGLGIQESNQGSGLGALDVKVHHHLINSGPFSAYVDFAAAVSYANQRTPSSGTEWNCLLLPGLGATWRLADRTYLLAGARFWHLSNAHLQGPEHNPSINAVDGYVGVMFLF